MDVSCAVVAAQAGFQMPQAKLVPMRKHGFERFSAGRTLVSENITFVHLTDLHVGNPSVEDSHLYSDTSATLRRILADIKSLQPQPKFIVASGDLTNQGDAGSYENLKSIVAEAGLDM